MVAQTITVLLASLIQTANAISFFDIRPNLPLIVLVPLMFVIRNKPAYFFLVLLSAIIIKTNPGLEDELLIFISLLVVFYLVSSLVPWQSFITNGLFLAATSIALSWPGFYPLELIANIILGSAALYIFKLIYAR